MYEMPRMIGRFATLVSWTLLIVLALSTGGCATRFVRSPIVNRMGVQVDLVREVRGFTTLPRGYEHPTIISVERMAHILNAVEIETRGEGVGAVRQPAFHPEIVNETAKAIAEGLAQASPDQEVGVKIVRKEMRFGVFHKKYLTSFLVYVDEGQLYLLLHRIEWFVSQRDDDGSLPEPRRDTHPMDFRVVSGQHLYYAGPQALEIDWQNPVFQTAYRLPGSTRGAKRRREVIAESAVPRDEREAASNRDDGVAIGELTSDQLRALADLEDDRRDGRITETAYQRAKRQLLRQR